MYAMTKMRFKQGKGDPGGFIQFLRQENIKPGIIVRSVGNRFHVVFHLAGVLYFLRDKLLKYLDTSCRNTTSLRSALQKDLRNDKLLLQLQALGIVGKLVTGPWMQQLYGNPGITNLDTISYIKTCLQYLKSLMDCPLLVFTTCKDIFGIDLDKESDIIRQCLQSNFSLMNAQEKKSLNDILSRLITGIIEVIERQMRVIYPVFHHLWQVKCSLPLHIICLLKKHLD